MTPPSLLNAEPTDWHRPLTPPTADALHLWWWNTTNELALGEALLGVAERARAERLATDELKRRFLAAHCGMRRILASYLHCKPVDLEIEVAEHGKPFLVGGPLQFNMAHSADEVLLAVSVQQVGVDIERHRPVTRHEKLATKHFSSGEIQWMRELASVDQLQRFFDIWSRKEAITKLTGLGLRASVKPLDTNPAEGADGTVEVPSNWPTMLKACWLSSVETGDALSSAIALPTRPSTVRVLRPSDH